MLSQLLNQMDEHLSKKPFIRTHWWSRRWIVYMTIQPPLTKGYPLWSRTKDELQLLRLFHLSPEELGQKIERYWKKPRWRRWFASFGMNKKIDVWNYYQRCLAYQEVRQNKLISEKSLVIANESQPILENLASFLHKSNVKFEAYLEKCCRNPKWVGKHLLKEVKRHQQQLEKNFSLKLNKHLKHISTQGEQLAIKQQAEKEYQQVEALMFHYYQLWHFNAFSRIRYPEVGIDVLNDREINENQERRVAVYTASQIAPSSSRAFNRRVVLQNGIGSLDKAKEWIQAQRQHLKSFIEEDSLQKVEELLQISMNEIKNITEPQLKCCETIISNIKGNYEAYDSFLEHLDNLQNQLKPLLQGGVHLFHPDHVMNLTPSQEIWAIITRYSQMYLEQSRFYFDSLKNYHQHIGEFYKHHLQKHQALQERAEIAIRIQKLEQSIQELNENYSKFWDRMETRLEQDKTEMHAQLEQDKIEMEAKWEQRHAKMHADTKAEWEQDKTEMNTKWKQVQAKMLTEMAAKLEQDKAEADAKLKEAEVEIRTYLKAKLEQGIEKGKNSDDNHVNEEAISIPDSAEKPILHPSF